MATNLFKRGEYVIYQGSITRFAGTHWRVDGRVTAQGRTTYTLGNKLLGQRLRNVASDHVLAESTASRA